VTGPSPGSLDGLDDFSRSFAEALLRTFPEFAPHATNDRGVLLIELSPGVSRPDCAFYVSTDGDEITVGLGIFHTHIDWPARNPGELWGDPIAFIRALTADELLIVNRFRDGKWAGSTTITAAEALGPIEIAPGDTAHVRSWSGAADRSITQGR
jgi:hypothetical protein